jgi:hypothetical protein
MGFNDECFSSDIPIIFFGGDSGEVADHINNAITLGMPMFLNKRQGKHEDWGYRDFPPCAGQVQKGSNKQCDEYPFNITEENKSLRPNVSLMPVTALDNSKAGGYLGVFFSQCNIVAGDPDRKEFAVISAPFVGQTTWYCGAQ